MVQEGFRRRSVTNGNLKEVFGIWMSGGKEEMFAAGNNIRKDMDTNCA